MMYNQTYPNLIRNNRNHNICTKVRVFAPGIWDKCASKGCERAKQPRRASAKIAANLRSTGSTGTLGSFHPSIARRAIVAGALQAYIVTCPDRQARIVRFPAERLAQWRGHEGQLRLGMTSSIDAGAMAGIGASASLLGASAKVASDLMAFCTRSSSHMVAACCGSTNIPRPAGEAQKAGTILTVCC